MSVSDPTEYEVTLSMPEGGIPARGGSISVPEIGDSSVQQAFRLRAGKYVAEPGEVVVRLRLSTEPTKYP